MDRQKKRAGPRLLLRLYVAGNAPNSLLAIANLKALCALHFASIYDLQIVDMLEHPLEALSDRIIVTPTLLKLHPLPAQRMIGTLDDPGQLLSTLRNP